MKRLGLIFSFLFLFCSLGFSQGLPQFVRNYSFTATGNSPVIALPSTGYNYIKLSWDVSGGGPATLSACAFSLQGASDGATFSTTHDSVASCTTDGQNSPKAISGATSYLRVNVSAFTASFGAPVLSVIVMAWDDILGAAATEPIFTTNQSVVSGTAAYAGTGSTVTTLSTTSATVATANTIYLGQLSCYNSSTTTPDNFFRTDTAGNVFETTFAIPAKSNYIRTYAQPEKMVGLKWWATTGTINCTVTATQ